MKKVVEFLQANPVQYLATVGRDGKAKCRPFMFLFEQDGKLWFCTNNTKEVYKDMQANPEIEVTVSSPAMRGCVSTARPYSRTIWLSKRALWAIPS